MLKKQTVPARDHTFAELDTRSGAVFSARRTFRYALWRNWDNHRPKIVFVGLNPSTADENQDDPTIRRCISFARTWGYGGVLIGNLFAFRATRPADLKKTPMPIGRDNNKWLDTMIVVSGRVLACWGNHGSHLSQDRLFVDRYSDLYCLAVNSTGAPVHPLYQPGSSIPSKYHPSKSGRTSTALSRPS